MIKKIFGQKFRTLTLKYSQSNFFDRGIISNSGTLFYAIPRLKLLYRIGPCSHPLYHLSNRALVIQEIFYLNMFILSEIHYYICYYWRTTLHIIFVLWSSLLICIRGTLTVVVQTADRLLHRLSVIWTATAAARFQSSYILFLLNIIFNFCGFLAEHISLSLVCKEFTKEALM